MLNRILSLVQCRGKKGHKVKKERGLQGLFRFSLLNITNKKHNSLPITLIVAIKNKRRKKYKQKMISSKATHQFTNRLTKSHINITNVLKKKRKRRQTNGRIKIKMRYCQKAKKHRIAKRCNSWSLASIGWNKKIRKPSKWNNKSL